MNDGGRTNIFKQLKSKLLLDRRTCLDILRGPLPPTIGLAIYQSDYIASQFSAFGYLVAVISILTNCLAPRTLFIRSAVTTLFLLLLGACITLLAGYCTIQARQHTTPQGAPATSYNSSAAAVTGAWLFAVIWAASTLRAYRPALNVNVIIFSIYTEITIVQHTQQPDMQQAISFDLELLEATVVGVCLSIGISLFIFPTTSRQVFFKDVEKHLIAIKTTLEAESSYVASFERSTVLKVSTVENLETHTPAALSKSPEAYALEKAMNELAVIHTQTRTDLRSAKEEIGWSSWEPNQLHDLFRLMRRIVVALRGLTTMVVLYERLMERRGWASFSDEHDNNDTANELHDKMSPEEDARERKEWSLIFRDYREPIERLHLICAAALKHTSIALRGNGNASRSIPQELLSSLPSPVPAIQSPDFVTYFREQVSISRQRRSRILSNWERRKSTQGDVVIATSKLSDLRSRHNQEQLLVILYFQNLYHGLLDDIEALLLFVDRHMESKHVKHLIIPGRRKLMKTFGSVLKAEDQRARTTDADEGRSVPLYHVPTRVFGAMDTHPEYLKPKNVWQVFGNRLRKVSTILSSPQSLYGLRVSCAVMCIALIALLGETSAFFFRQRLVWAMIIIAFSMNPTSGASFSTFIYRAAGSILATVLSIVNWYIVDGHPAGVLVMFWLFGVGITYLSSKYPKYAAVWRIHMITTSIMVGYALQTQKTGIQAPPATSSNHYPMYLIAPYRLATTFVGIFVAFIWTVFPAPVTARSVLRRRLGEALYVLANYYSSAHTTMAMYLEDQQGDVSQPTSPGRILEKARGKLFVRELAILASLRENSALSRFEPTIGGDFPIDTYTKIIGEVDNLLSHINLVAHAAMTLEGIDDNYSETQTVILKWKHSLGIYFRSADFNSHNIAMLLSLLASCVMNGQPLPPFLEAPKPYHLAQQLQYMDPELLKMEHAVRNPVYGAFAVSEVSAAMIAESLRRILFLVKNLVGEVDFDFAGKLERGEKTA